MPNFEANLTSARFGMTTAPLEIALSRTAEMWQFFAFIFGALLTIAFTFIDEMPATRWRIVAKVVMSLVIAYGTLLSPRGRSFLVRVLVSFKTL